MSDQGVSSVDTGSLQPAPASPPAPALADPGAALAAQIQQTIAAAQQMQAAASAMIQASATPGATPIQNAGTAVKNAMKSRTLIALAVAGVALVVKDALHHPVSQTDQQALTDGIENLFEYGGLIAAAIGRILATTKLT